MIIVHCVTALLLLLFWIFYPRSVSFAEHFVNIKFLVLLQKSVTRKKYATRDEDLFSDSTDIFADIPSQRSSQAAASSTKTTDRRLQPAGDDGDYDFVVKCNNYKQDG